MSARTDRVESLFSAVLQRQTAEAQHAFLEQACGTDRVLRQRVQALLDAHGRADNFLGKPLAVVQVDDKTDPHGHVPSPQGGSIGEKPSDQIGPYKLLQEIGHGGMGVVFMAEQEAPVRRKVAMKIVKPGLDTKEVVARFEAERQALALMDHPNIARVLDGGATDSGRPFFVMELVQGVSIIEYCDQAKLSTRQRLELFVLVCRAVQHAHHKGIIHRDIKPTNIMVTMHDGTPVPKVIDFGIAKATDQRLTDKTLFTRYGEFIGTPAYMSPEQAERSGLDVDTRSDVYSLGALLYELLTGTPPIDSARLSSAAYEEVLSMIRHEEPRTPSAVLSTLGDRLTTIAEQRKTDPAKLASQIKGELDWIVMKAMEKDRTRRYETASALALDITKFLSGEVITARPPTTFYRLQKFVRRNRASVIVAALVAGMLIAATAASGHWAWRATKAERLARGRLVAERKARRQAEDLHTRAVEAERQAAAEAKRAARESELSAAVLDFMNKDILAHASPDGQRDRDITLRQTLDRAARTIDGRFENQPGVEAVLRAVVGRTYASLGEYSRAERHLNRSWRLRVKLFGDRSVETLAVANDLVRAHLNQGQYEKATSLLDNLRVATRQTLGEDHLETLKTMNLLAWLDESQGRFADAERLLTSVLKRRKRIQGQTHPDTSMAINNLAYVYQSQGQLDKAEPLFLKALDQILQQQGQWHPQTLTVMNNLASLYLGQGRLADAEVLYRDALHKAEASLGAKHPHTLMLLNSLALNCYQQQRFDEAEQLFFKSLRYQRQQLGDDHPNTLTTKHNLAALYQDQQRHEDAERLYAETWVQRKEVLGASHPDTLTTLNNFAFLYLTQERYAEAKPLYEETTKLVPQAFGENHDNVVISLAMLGLCQLQGAAFDQAEATLRDALRRCRTGHWIQYMVQSMLGGVLMENGRMEEAKSLLVEAQAGLTAVGDALPHPWKRIGLQETQRRIERLNELTDGGNEVRARRDDQREIEPRGNSSDP